ncbi:MAG: gldN [Mucilaginibacter sp.]|nr:gldN [Mucilaginibacter sp.]
MKRRVLIIVLCLACTASFAQKAKKKTTNGTAGSTTANKPGTKIVSGDTTKKTVVVSQGPSQTAPATTPGKPFERPLDGYYKKNNIANAKVTAYANLRESDVVYSRRVWREFDLREKMNQYMASPKQRLIDVLMDAVGNGELTAYDPTPTKEDPDGDAFSTPLTPAKAKAKMADSTVVDKFDNQGNKIKSELVAGEFNPDSVVKFRLKEDWVFDKQRSVEEVRIVGIAPLIKQKVPGASVSFDYQPAFWIYFPAARQILVTKEAVNRRNDATGLSFDDVFIKRLFTSYIVKQSNDKDERIKDYAQGIDRLYESEKIKKSLMDWELNLWQY